MILTGIERFIGTQQCGPPRIDARISRQGVTNDNDIAGILGRLWCHTVRAISYLCERQGHATFQLKIRNRTSFSK